MDKLLDRTRVVRNEVFCVRNETKRKAGFLGTFETKRNEITPVPIFFETKRNEKPCFAILLETKRNEITHIRSLFETKRHEISFRFGNFVK